MARSLVKEITTTKTYRFEAKKVHGRDVINVFMDTEKSRIYLGWVVENNANDWLDPEVVAVARKFLKGV
jgi:hypothetical protein